MDTESAAPIIWLEDISLDQRSQVGGKAAALGTLWRAGVPVPDGFCIPAGMAPDDDEQWWGAIGDAYRKLAPHDGPVAVRSSGEDEDSAGASFAGQYETVLNVRGMDALRAAIAQCQKAAGAARVEAYRSGHGRGHGAKRIPLLVQQQVLPEVSGVLFTSDPVSGGDDEMLIEAAPGLGEGLVSGHTSPAQYRITREGSLRTSSAEGPLTPEQCRALAELGTSIERVLGTGQDIEWALGRGQLYILQARPITGASGDIPLSQMWTRANVGEVLPHPITPLTWSVFRATLYHNPSLALTESCECSEEDSSIARFHGRAYIRMDNLLDTFCYLPATTPQVMSQVLGVSLPRAALSYARPAGLFVRLSQIAFVLDALGFLPRLSWLVRRMPSPPAAARGNLAELLTWTSRCFRLHLKCTAYAIGAFALLAGLLNRWPAGDAKELLPRFLADEQDVQTAAQGRSLWRLAEMVRDHPELRRALQTTLTWCENVLRLPDVAGGTEFLQALEAFLATHGARTAGEFELATPRWREAPSLVVDVLLKFAEAQDAPDLPSGRASQRDRHMNAREALDGAPLPLRLILTRIAASYGSYTAARENVKYRLMEGYALLRQAFLDMGNDLRSQGLLDDIQDVFFLTSQEILGMVEGNRSGHQVRDQIEDRKRQHSRWAAEADPYLVVGNGSEVIDSPSGSLVGIGCSPGTVEGTARVLSDISEMDSLKPGEILVAPHTDPGWTPLFLVCKAIVTEVGGFLSHGATVAREYGVPAVVNVRGATTRIHTGDLIRVDGARGQVTVCSTKHPS